MSTTGSPTPAPRGTDGTGAPGPPLAPVRVSSTVDEVTDRLVTAIALGAFVPGERLPAERELSRMLGVSRSTVREAIGRLRAAAVVEIRRGRAGGAYVGARWAGDSARAVRRTLQPRLPDLELLFDLRARVEEMVARAAAERRTAEDVRALEAALAGFAAATGPVEEHRCDSVLHDAVLGAAGNPHLTSLSRDLLSRVSLGLPFEPYRHDVYDRALHEHTELVRAVVAGDVERAGRTARDHFALSAEALRETLADGVAQDTEDGVNPRSGPPAG